jgi:hypothetical protein
MTFFVSEVDNGKILEAVFTDQAGAAFDLTGYDVKMWVASQGSVSFTVTDAGAGKAQYLTVADTWDPGTYDIEFELIENPGTDVLRSVAHVLVVQPAIA